MSEQIQDFFTVNSIEKFIKNFFLQLLTVILLVLLIFILSKVLMYVMHKVIQKTLRSKKASEQRIITVCGMIDNLVKYITAIILFIVILVAFGVPWESLLAGAGILGIIIGLGAQELISDTINGFFVIFEGTYEVGEYIKVNNFEGYVIDLGIKSTVLRTFENKKITIPNSKVQEVVNYSKNNYELYYYFSASYDDSLKTVVEIINKDIIPKMKELETIYDVNYIGLDNFEASAIVYGLCITIDPENRFSVKRRTNEIVKQVFDEHGLEIPYQNITLSYKKEQDVKEVE